MKELSIEEKAKAYDEAIEIAKEINNEQRAQPFNVMTRVFRPATPEEIPHSESEQEELNEFEKWFKKLIGCYASAMGTPLIEQPEDRQNDFVKKHAQSLLSIARKQIASEINVDEMVQKFKDGVEENPHGILACLTLRGAYKLGMNDTLKAIKENSYGKLRKEV